MDKKIKFLKTINKWAIGIAALIFTVNMLVFSIAGYPTFISQYKEAIEQYGSDPTKWVITFVLVLYAAINLGVFTSFKFAGDKITMVTVSKSLILTALAFVVMPGLAGFESTVNSTMLHFIVYPGLAILYTMIFVLLLMMKAYTSIIEKQNQKLSLQ